MSIEHLKKQAKNLHRHLPEFLAKNPQPFSLSACQELVARSSGYPSWHAASTAPARNPPSKTVASSRELTFYPLDVSTLQSEADLQPVFRHLCFMDPDTVIFVNGTLPTLARKLEQVGVKVEEMTMAELRKRLEQCDYQCGFEVVMQGDCVRTGGLSQAVKGSRMITLPIHRRMDEINI